MARTAATSASTSVAKPAASTSRTSNPRKAASKRISYFESGKEDEDEEMEDAGGEGDTTLVGEEEEEEDEEPSGTLELAQLVKAFSKSRTKTEKAEAAKVAQQLKAVLEDGQKKVDEMVEKSREESAALLTSLNLDAPPSLGRLQPKNYQAAFAEQHALTQQLIKHVDEYKREVDPAEDAFFEAARQAPAANKLPLPSRHSFLRARTLAFFSSPSALLCSYLLPSSRPNGIVDGVLKIASAADRRRAVQWRSCTFASHLPCAVCGQRFSRGCAAHSLTALGAFDEDGPVDPARVEPILERVAQLKTERERSGAASGTFGALDFLLGNKRDLAEIGFVTLRVWEAKMEEYGRLCSQIDVSSLSPA
ncbi:hypothetical protein JCM8097_006081 [Rhodosporidiobolus ruineniae]